MLSFKEMNLSEEILKAVEELGFVEPTPVQEKVIPHLLGENEGDLVVTSQTGTGKTASFGFPIIEKTDVSKSNIQHLVLCPTRELCLQVADDISTYAKFLKGIKVAAIFGGANIERQIRVIKSGAQIVVATPGRLIDLMNRKEVNLAKINTLVLDEADEMLAMGFRDDLEEILADTPKHKKTLMFSATMPNEILEIAKKYLNDFEQIGIGKKNSGAEGVSHECYMVHSKDRYMALKRIVDYCPEIYGIVFCRTRQETQEVAEKLMEDGYNADALHGDLSQNQRDHVMGKFRSGHLSLLVATDVAARGIDVDDLTHVINYNIPDELEVYTHRSGRTGRAGKKGISVVIANLKEKRKIQIIEKQIKKQFTFKKVPAGREVCEKQLFHMIDRIEKIDVNETEIDSFLPIIYRKLEWLDREELIKKFVSIEFNRFLEYYKDAQDINTFDSTGRGSSIKYERMFINLGRKDGISPQDLIGLINEFTGIRSIPIGKIKILQYFSFFEIDKTFIETLLDSFKNKEVDGRKVFIEISQEDGKDQSRKRPDYPRSRRDYDSRGNSSGRDYRKEDSSYSSRRKDYKSNSQDKPYSERRQRSERTEDKPYIRRRPKTSE
ncbi:MAG TPA: DEAD/DEAH box helicase [Candidatus Cloacimonadota bacterium]|nr:DEAD/DEAH box helicase [Candidatus Cloacimonadota bacterium]